MFLKMNLVHLLVLKPHSVSSNIQDITLRDYYRRPNELSVLAGCILWGSRVIIPSQGRAQLLAELHDGHPAMSRI